MGHYGDVMCPNQQVMALLFVQHATHNVACSASVPVGATGKHTTGNADLPGKRVCRDVRGDERALRGELPQHCRLERAQHGRLRVARHLAIKLAWE